MASTTPPTSSAPKCAIAPFHQIPQGRNRHLQVRNFDPVKILTRRDSLPPSKLVMALAPDHALIERYPRGNSE